MTRHEAEQRFEMACAMLMTACDELQPHRTDTHAHKVLKRLRNEVEGAYTRVLSLSAHDEKQADAELAIAGWKPEQDAAHAQRVYFEECVRRVGGRH